MPKQTQTSAAEMLLVLAVFVAAAAALFVTAPVELDFWWSDAPRHALNGVFIRDLVAAMPVHDPAGWALAYYAKYPALTILFYPPAFYVVEAVFYALFGVSHAVAQLSVAPYLVLLGVSATAVARRALPLGSAIGVGLLAVGTPLSALWGRQVMLDVPAYALLMAAVWCSLRHARSHNTGDLVLAALAFIAAVYTKQTAIFILPALLVAFLRGRGAGALRERRVVVVAVLAVIAALPLVYLTLKFGAVNVQSVEGRPAICRASAWAPGCSTPSKCRPSWAGRRWCWGRAVCWRCCSGRACWARSGVACCCWPGWWAATCSSA